MRFEAKRFLIVDDQEYSVKIAIRKLKAEGAEVVFVPSLYDAYTTFETMKQAGEQSRPFDLVLIDILCPPLPAQLRPYFDDARLPDNNSGIALAHYLEKHFKDRQPYALFTILPHSGIYEPPKSHNYKGIIEKIGAQAIADRVQEIIGQAS